MTGLEKWRRAQVSIAETLFQIAEEYDCIVDDFRFIPTKEGHFLFFNMNGNKFRWSLPSLETQHCVGEGSIEDRPVFNREKIKQQFRDLLIIHKGVIKSKAR